MLLTPLLQQSYWKVVLKTGRTLSERDLVADPVKGRRLADWTLDLVTTGDILRVRELHLIYPGLFTRPAVLRIVEPGTAFQMKTASAMISMADASDNRRQLEAQTIGRVIDKLTGECECFIWDRMLGVISYRSNIYQFGRWHERIAPIGALSQQVLGLRL